MKSKFIAALVLLALTGVAGLFYQQSFPRPPESWLVEMMPTEVEGFRVQPKDSANPNISYRMDKMSYEKLDPIGIAAQRVRDEAGREIDVVVIAGDSMDAFHDQQVCFTAQGWAVRDMQQVLLNTRTRGQVVVSKMLLFKDGREQDAIYLFRSPKRFNTYQGAKLDFFMQQLTQGKPGVGFSYRFIAMTPDVDRETLIRYAIAFLDQANETTKGVL